MYSFDVILGVESAWTPALKALALALGVAGGVANLLIRRPVTQAAHG
jgi:hypothetical protein